MKRRIYLLCFDSSVLSIAAAKDPQPSDDYGNRQGDPAPIDLLEGDGEVRVRSVIMRWRVHKVEPGVLHRTKFVTSVSLPEYWRPDPPPLRPLSARPHSPAFCW